MTMEHARAGKYSVIDAGNRLPFRERWPHGIIPGSLHAPIAKIDVYARFSAEMTHSLEAGIAPRHPRSAQHLLRFWYLRMQLYDPTEFWTILSPLSQGDWKIIESSDKAALEYWSNIEMWIAPLAPSVQSFHGPVRNRQCGRSPSGQGKNALCPTGRGEGSKDPKWKGIKVQEWYSSQVLYEFVLYANY